MRDLIVYTRFDGGVNIGIPGDECIAAMSSGGHWDDRPRGFLDEQIERQIAAGIAPHAAVRFARAVQFGGCTTAEAFDIIRDRDHGHLGTGFELWHRGDLPDRWFRNAWRRSHNGGPIGIDMAAARRIQLRRLTKAAERSNAVLQFGRWKDRIRKARTPEELRQTWPQGLTHGA